MKSRKGVQILEIPFLLVELDQAHLHLLYLAYVCQWKEEPLITRYLGHLIKGHLLQYIPK